MNVLAFDTCFGACSAAVRFSAASKKNDAGEDFSISFQYEEMATGHAERLMPMIDEVLRDAGCTFGDLDTIAVTEGPGSFTGLRVGVAAARSFALAAGLPIRATSSLHVMAHREARQIQGMPGDTALAICVDARNNQVYAQLFSAALDVLTSPMIMSPPQVAALVAPSPLLVLGSGAQLVAEAAHGIGRKVEARAPELLPDARDLATMAPVLPVRKPLIPVYLRAPDAKPQTGKSLPRA
jgi:tRNA threonylcarbamoyladenosine biosynthesis protein TsaB